ncbi:MAG: hypothetical protein ACTSWA_08890 [Candidatus Thorarchaeota archaeon]
MRRRKAQATILMSIVIVVSFSLALIFAHDNPAELTPISSINAGITPLGSNVTIKGNITSIMMYHVGLNDQVVSLSDGSGSLRFYWSKTHLEVGWIVIVKGTVHRNNSLRPVSSVELVLLFP